MTDYKRAGYLMLAVLLLRIAAEFLLPLVWNGQDLMVFYALNGLIISIGVIYVPALLFLNKGREEELFGRRKVTVPTLVWSALLGIGVFQLSTGFNALVQMGFSALGLNGLSAPLPSADGWRLPALLVLMAVLPAITEETLFRGALLQAWRPLGRTKSILLTSLLFALFHFNPLNIPAILLISWFLGCASYDSRSIYPSMMIHGVNNLISTLFSLLAAALPESAAAEITTSQMLLSVGSYLITGTLITLVAYRGFRRSLVPLPEPAHEPRGGLALPAAVCLVLLLAGNAVMLAYSMGYIAL